MFGEGIIYVKSKTEITIRFTAAMEIRSPIEKIKGRCLNIKLTVFCFFIGKYC